MRLLFSTLLTLLFPIILLSLKAPTVGAGEADVISAEVEHTGGNFYRFSVTVQHDDESWEHFSKAWEVLDLDGNILGARILLHPHINEQPFTRSQTISLPENINQVTIRAYDLVHKFGGKELTLEIRKSK
jgi:hypothetical protein